MTNDEFYFGELRKKDEIIEGLKRDIRVQKLELDKLEKAYAKKSRELDLALIKIDDIKGSGR